MELLTKTVHSVTRIEGSCLMFMMQISKVPRKKSRRFRVSPVFHECRVQSDIRLVAIGIEATEDEDRARRARLGRGYCGRALRRNSAESRARSRSERASGCSDLRVGRVMLAAKFYNATSRTRLTSRTEGSARSSNTGTRSDSSLSCASENHEETGTACCGWKM